MDYVFGFTSKKSSQSSIPKDLSLTCCLNILSNTILQTLLFVLSKFLWVVSFDKSELIN